MKKNTQYEKGPNRDPFKISGIESTKTTREEEATGKGISREVLCGTLLWTAAASTRIFLSLMRCFFQHIKGAW